MLTAKQQIMDTDKSNDVATLEFYRQIGEGYKAMQEGREVTLDEVIKKIEKRRNGCG